MYKDIMAGILRNESSTEEDLLWPQTEGTMVSSNGTLLDDVQSDMAGTTPVYIGQTFFPKCERQSMHIIQRTIHRGLYTSICCRFGNVCIATSY